MIVEAMWSASPWLAGAAGLISVALSVAVVAGRDDLRPAAIAAGALTLSLGLLGLGWGVVHGLHSVYETDAVARRDGIMAGVSVGLNAFQAALLCLTVTTVCLFVDALREARRGRRAATRPDSR